ncbi:UNVERIFIED_CONTAM: hypothetical protein NCL1_31841 [Trichonephila clavipes]
MLSRHITPRKISLRLPTSYLSSAVSGQYMHRILTSSVRLTNSMPTEGLIASSYEYPKCNGRHDVTLWAIKRLLRNRSSHAEGMFATIPLQKKYGGAHTIIHLAMRPLSCTLHSEKISRKKNILEMKH